MVSFIFPMKLHRLSALKKITFYMQKKMSGILQLLLLKHRCVWTTCKRKHMPKHVHTCAHRSNNNPQPLVLLRTLLKILRIDPCVLLKPQGTISAVNSTAHHGAELRNPSIVTGLSGSSAFQQHCPRKRIHVVLSTKQ